MTELKSSDADGTGLVVTTSTVTSTSDSTAGSAPDPTADPTADSAPDPTAGSAFDPTSAGGTVRRWVTWEELRVHASFPIDASEIADEIVPTPLGELATRRSTVTSGAQVRVRWFALDHPGAPVRYETRVGGELVERTITTEIAALP